MPDTRPTLDRKAAEVHASLVQVGIVGFDPVTILAIILAMIQIWQKCNLTPKQVMERCHKPRRLDLIMLRRAIRNNIATSPVEYFDDDAVEAALLDAGADLTQGQVSALIRESQATE